MKSLKILIIEDEPATARRLEKLLGELNPDMEILAILDTVEDAVKYFGRRTEIDLAFMDIHLADGNSFEIFEQVSPPCPIIFTTAYDQYAIKAFKVNSIDYLLKPVKRNELESSIEKFSRTRPVRSDYSELLDLLQKKPENHLSRFVVKVGQVIKTVEVADVAYFVVEHKSVYGILEDGSRNLIDHTMEQLENELDSRQFFRINRSMIVNFAAINKMVSYSKSRIKIELDPPYGKDSITSSERSPAFKAWLAGK